MSTIQVILLAVLQGVTELFPVSSLGHAVIVPSLLHWNVDQNGAGFLPFLVVMHLGTAVALLVYFWRDWWDFAMAVLLNRGARAQQDRRLFWRVVVATIPAVVVGFAFEKLLRHVFASAMIAAIFLIVNGVILFAAERLKRQATRRIDELSWGHALFIGVCQCLALIPGISRSGTTMVGGFLSGLDHEDAARFSFLTATPIILGAAVLEVPKLHKEGAHFSTQAWGAGVVAGAVAYVSLWALMRWFKKHEFKAFDPFAIYCWLAGAVSLALLAMGV
ncbi:undecaprenyl-diphosphate phosphatase [Caulobacter sp. S45]|uniref:undecaprenyl-diphosphate phosphatase n=1 Tax=Caulobacter sp. S45 TaxID=1641861 RepID=UPI00131CDE02|nr:undecaprenyl-diphosphate phosphatase [Caulobacter sp. S45]